MVMGAWLLLAVLLNTPVLQRWFSSALCEFLGKISYALYLTHYLILWSVTCTLFLWLSPQLGYVAAAWTSFILSLPLMAVIAYGCYRWVDQGAVGFSKWLYTRFFRHGYVAAASVLSNLQQRFARRVSRLSPSRLGNVG